MDGWIDTYIVKQTNGWMDGWMGGWVGGRGMDGWMDGWMGGWMDRPMV
jgi:hypothetical protein